jgi:dihydroxyacetone kinase-like predicted kinase
MKRNALERALDKTIAKLEKKDSVKYCLPIYTEAQIAEAEKIQAKLYEQYDRVEVKPFGDGNIIIEAYKK